MTSAETRGSVSYESALIFRIAQIVDGDVECSVCGKPAAFVVANGADPDDDPVCVDHGLEWMRFASTSVRGLFTAPS